MQACTSKLEDWCCLPR